MSLGLISLSALVIAIIVSCFTELNVGLLSIALAWIIGVYLGGMPLRDVTAGFPVGAFLTLTGVSLLFSLARVNGTLELVAHEGVRLCRGRVGFVPVLYFFLAAVIASSGPGHIATIGLLGPVAMASALRMNISPFLMAIMVGNGAQAGSLSPIAPTGIIVAPLMEKIGLPGLQVQSWLYTAFAHALVAFSGYLIFGGGKLLLQAGSVKAETEAAKPFDRNHRITLGTIAVLIAGVVVLNIDIGMAAFTAFVLLTLVKAGDQAASIKAVPWSSILMLSGVTVLVSLLEKTSGLELLTDFIVRVSTPGTIIPLLAIMIGLISAYSSTSTVVLPAFLPTVSLLVAKLGVVSPFSIAMTMNVSAHLVDVSPLSTTGGLCVASLPAGPESRRLFNQLLVWGLSMSVVGAVICWFLFA